MQALVTSGADPSVIDFQFKTPLIWASTIVFPNFIACLLQLPAARATVDIVDQDGRTALPRASVYGHASSVQLLLDAGADPTIPAGDCSPLNCAIRRGHTAVAALLRHAINEPDRARTLHKARALLDAGLAVRNAGADSGNHDNDDDEQQPPRRHRMHTRGQQKRAAIPAAPVYIQGRLQQPDEAPLPLPVPELAPQRGGDERVRATVAFVLGLEEGGVAYAGLPRELYEEVLGYVLPAWADKGPEEVGDDENDNDSESESGDDDGSGSESGSESKGSDTD